MLFVKEVLPNPEASVLVVPVNLLNQVFQEAFCSPVLNRENLDGVIHSLLPLEVQSHMCLKKFLLILFLLLELVLCLSVAVPCDTKHPRPDLFEDFTGTILLSGHLSVLHCPSVKVETEMPLESLSHQFLYVLGGDRFHTLIFLFYFLLDFSVVRLHLNLGSLKLFHDFHLHGDGFVGSTFAPKVEG